MCLIRPGSREDYVNWLFLYLGEGSHLLPTGQKPGASCRQADRSKDSGQSLGAWKVLTDTLPSLGCLPTHPEAYTYKAPVSLVSPLVIKVWVHPQNILLPPEVHLSAVPLPVQHRSKLPPLFQLCTTSLHVPPTTTQSLQHSFAWKRWNPFRYSSSPSSLPASGQVFWPTLMWQSHAQEW